MQDFVFNGQPSRVVFGVGSLKHLEREIEAMGAKRALVLSTPEQSSQARHIADLLGSRAAGIFSKAVMHVPIETAREAREVAAKLGADCAVAVGGGSTTGLGKAIALDSGLPIMAIPTTYAGSEMTPIYGITEAGLKKTGRDPRVLPATLLWMSNGGRYSAPWKGRHVNVMGVEDVTGFFHTGLNGSARPNALSKRGLTTCHQLRADRPFAVRYIMAVAAIPRRFEQVKDIIVAPDKVTLVGEHGVKVSTPLDADFLKGAG